MNITVIVPTRGNVLLGDALRSIAAQTLAPDELIVVEDGCPAAETDCDLHRRVLSLPSRKGAAGARNAGARAAGSEWLAFLDDDDCWLPEYLSRASAAAGGADVVCTSFLASLDGMLSPEKEAPLDLESADFYGRNPGLRASNLMIRRELFLSVGGFDESLPALHDIDLGLRLARARPRYARVAERLVVYRKHRGSRISAYGSPELKIAVPRFLELHGATMSADQKQAYRRRVRRYFDADALSGEGVPS